MNNGSIRKLGAVVLYFVCGLAGGFAVATLAWGIPQYRFEKAGMSSDYLGFFRGYAYMQYKQAAPQQGKEALLEYLHAIERLKAKNIPQLKQQLAFESGLAYLRLYHLAQASTNVSEAEEDMKNAQRAYASLGWTDVSAATLNKLFETREASEARNDEKLGILPSQSSADGRRMTQP